jgi:2'-hydroxyisoflavone reductase
MAGIIQHHAALAATGAQPWSEVPLYIPETSEYSGYSQVAIAQALAAGLHFRPVAQTVAVTLAWAQTRPADHPWRAGLSPEREAAILSAAGEG